MATQSIYHDLNLEKVSQLVQARIQNITTTDRTTLGGTLNTNHIGLVVLDTDLDRVYFWDGAAWVALGTTITGAMTFKGVVAFGAVEPVTPATGDYYVFNTAGTNTWEGSTVVQIGDATVWDGTAWQFIQGNVVASSETIAGIIEIATQAETNAGSDDTRAVTPLKLTSFATTKAFAKTYFASGVSLVANTAFTVTHNLGLQNRNAFTINVMDSTHSGISVDVDSVDVNSLTITSAVALTGVSVTVIGF
jgi:hypothetical protein